MTRVRRSRIASMILAAALAAASAAAGLLSCSRPQAAQQRAPRAVRTALVQKRDFVVSADSSARITAGREIDIVPKVGGRVRSVRAEVGARVKAGQILFTLDPGDYDAQYRQAAAALQSASAALTRTSDAGQEQQLIQAQAAVDQAQVGFDDAQSLRDKTQKLFEGGVVPKQQLDDVEAKYRNAQIQLDAARKSLDLVRDKSGPQSSEIAAGQVDQARAQADLAKSQLDATVVTSPIDGLVSYRNVETGEMIGTSTLSFIVIDDRSLVAEAGLSERVIGSVRPGMDLEVVVDAFGTAPLRGKVDSVSPAADPRTMLYTVRVRLDGRDGLMPGMLAKISIPVETRKDALLIPESAAFSANGSDSVFVVREGRVELRRITLGESDGRVVEVRGGLSEGDRVVSSGQEFLNDGDAVTAE